MRKTLGKILSASLVLVSVVAAGTASAGQPDDAWITFKTKMKLLTSEDTPVKDVSVDTHRGKVTLHGRVESEQDKLRAGEVARRVDGVKEVRNLLQVVPDAKEKAVRTDDKMIEKEIEQAFAKDRSLADSSIEVESVNAGTVVLGGQAASLGDHVRALELARRVGGVTQVASQVKSPDRLSDDEIWRQRGDAGDSAGERGAKRAEGAVSDAWITTDLKMRLLANSETPAFDINVDTSGGTVTLFGIVPSAAAKQAAEAEARKIDGVQDVVNHLEVVAEAKKAAVERKDAEIQEAVQAAIDKDPSLADADIDVEVKNGVVRLTGTVASQGDRMVAAVNAREVDGVRSVREELRFSGERAAAK